MNIPYFQIFLGNPKSYTRRHVFDSDIQRCMTSSSSMYIHSPYLFSLANQDVFEKCKGSLVYELEVCNKLSCRCGGVVVHPGSHKDCQQGLDKIVDNINLLYRNHPDLGTLLLENSCAQGNTLPNTLEQLQYIIERVDNNANIGVCIDTCHAFASGMTAFEDSSEFRRKVDETIGLDKLKLIHLNDSMTPFRSRKDRHQTLGAGHIWTHQKLSNFLSTFFDIPMVSETGSYLEDLSFASQ